jgi:hypothetical protein
MVTVEKAGTNFFQPMEKHETPKNSVNKKTGLTEFWRKMDYVLNEDGLLLSFSFE